MEKFGFYKGKSLEGNTHILQNK